jgi:hypothetical protein
VRLTGYTPRTMTLPKEVFGNNFCVPRVCQFCQLAQSIHLRHRRSSWSGTALQFRRVFRRCPAFAPINEAHPIIPGNGRRRF